MSIRPININVMEIAKMEPNQHLNFNKISFINTNPYLINNESESIFNQNDNTQKLKWNKIVEKFNRSKIANRHTQYKTQIDVFHGAMRCFTMSGQFLGLFPILKVERDNLTKRFKILSWRNIPCIIVCLWQMVVALLCFYRVMYTSVSITRIAYYSFYLLNCLSSILFLRLASKWHCLMEQLSNAALNEYIDPYIVFKCNFAGISLLFLTLVEHAMSIISKISMIQDCYLKENDDIFELYALQNFSWLFDLKVQYSVPLGIYLVVLNFISTINWSYIHLFVICISLYLSSILERINKKIVSSEGKYMPQSYWRELREDYNRATRLVHSFDNVINSIMLESFASNLFFVCLQLYYALSNGVKFTQDLSSDVCSNYPSGIFNGYEYSSYVLFSLAFVILRFVAVALVTAKVHSASLVAAPSLYNVPSPSYCLEVQRFIEQVHGNTVALTGLNFFYVTKELILSVVGTIVTYELVLLQFEGDDAGKT